MSFPPLPAEGTWALIIVTVLITLSVTLFFKQVVVPILKLIVTPLVLLKECIYKWIAPRNPLSISLWRYRRHVLRSRLAYIENPVGPPIDVPLESAFAPLRLLSSDKDFELFEHVTEHYRTMILGEAGTGKTTLMKSLLVNILNNKANPELNELIPVFIRLRDLAAKKGHTVEQAIVSAFDDYHFPGAEKFVDSAIDQGKLVIILDGLDEVGVNRTAVAGAIQDFCEKDEQRHSKNRVVVTCREYSYRTRDLQSVIKMVVRVEPFSNHHMRIFLQGWPEYNGRVAIRLYSRIQEDPRIVEICRNPLLLTILIGLYLEATTKDFIMPSTRESFYKAALDELLFQRPARKEQTQKYNGRRDADKKRKLLAPASLERLETVDLSDDPEELSLEIIHKHAVKTFLNMEDFDIHELIRELVEMNGIIKPSGESSYTFSHRTFQEYLAAQEALRKRTIEQVLTRFGPRPDLSEVLLFYCSLNPNIPQLSQILEHFVSAKEWQRAGQCLINMQEVPDVELVEKICEKLYNKITTLEDYDSDLETLSSIAQLHGDEVDSARRLFSEAIDFLIQRMGETGTSVLESVLATKPKMALKVIPALREHGSPSVRRAGVRILRDIGTDEALDQLFEILDGPDGPERIEAARMLASLISSRKKELLERIVLLNDQKNKAIWPLEEYFPGTLAIPIAEALSSSPGEIKSGDPAIDLAAKAVREQNKATSFLRQWKNIARDIKLSHFRTFAGSILAKLSILGAIIYASAIILLAVFGVWSGQHFVVEIKPIKMYAINSQSLNQVQTEAEKVKSKIKNTYPPNAQGLSRILPWNWWTEPIVPSNMEKGYSLVTRLSYMNFDPYSLSTSELDSLNVLLPPNETKDLVTAIQTLEKELLPSRGRPYAVIGTATNSILTLIIISIGLMAFVYYYFHSTISRREIPQSSNRKNILQISWYVGGGMAMVQFISVSVPALIRGSELLVFGSLILFGILWLFGYSLRRLVKWPRNPYFDDIAHLVSLNPERE